MKKQAILRGLLGFPLGIAISQVISIVVSLFIADGQYYPYVPQLELVVGSALGAAIVQTVLSGVLGAAFASCSVVWELEHWGLAKQTGVYFIISSVAMFPIAYILNWIQHNNIISFIIYFAIYVVIFIFWWLVMYFVMRLKVKKLNDKL